MTQLIQAVSRFFQRFIEVLACLSKRDVVGTVPSGRAMSGSIDAEPIVNRLTKGAKTVSLRYSSGSFFMIGCLGKSQFFSQFLKPLDAALSLPIAKAVFRTVLLCEPCAHLRCALGRQQGVLNSPIDVLLQNDLPSALLASPVKVLQLKLLSFDLPDLFFIGRNTVSFI